MIFWYQKRWFVFFLVPLSWCYELAVCARRWCYHRRWFKIHRTKAPVIVVGNLSVGGTGKTPVVIELAKKLSDMGYAPGIVSRGYGGKAPHYPLIVSSSVDVNHSGDEPKLIAHKTNCPVVVDPNRPRAAEFLLDNFNCNVILSDDGLQHYALNRDIEIVVQDQHRGNGNNFCLPAGPLREPTRRLATVDYVLTHLDTHIDYVYQLNNPDNKKPLSEFITVHAVAGIGNPNKFFDLLRENNLRIIEHPLPDHHKFLPSDLNFCDDLPIIMTEKDAIKCSDFEIGNCWVMAISVTLPEKLYDGVAKLLNKPRVYN